MKVRLYELFSRSGKKLKKPKDYGIGGLNIDNNTAVFFDSEERTPAYPIAVLQVDVIAHGILIYGTQGYGDRRWYQNWYGVTSDEALLVLRNQRKL